MEYKVEDCGLLIGLINVPMGTDFCLFFNNEMKDTIFQQYREPIFGEDTQNNDTNHLYVPHAYHLLEEHNLAVLAWIKFYKP